MSCPSSIWGRDLNPQPLKHESSPITTRPGLPSRLMFIRIKIVQKGKDNFKIEKCHFYEKTDAATYF